ncbi:hypothetical protein BHM03_00059327, partial [Ensete ventricosum]
MEKTLSSTILPPGLAETCPRRQFPVSHFFKFSSFRPGILRTQEDPHVLRISVCQSDALRCSRRLRALAGDVPGNSEGGDEALGRGSGFLPAEGFPLIEVLLVHVIGPYWYTDRPLVWYISIRTNVPTLDTVGHTDIPVCTTHIGRYAVVTKSLSYSKEWARQQYMAKHQQWSSHQWGNFYYYRMQNI